MSDSTLALRNQFHLGAYQHVINQLSSRNLSSRNYEQDPDLLDQKCLLYRAYVAQGKFNLVITDIEDGANTPAELLALRMWALLLQFQTKAGAALPSRPALALTATGTPLQLPAEKLEAKEREVLEAVQTLLAEPVNRLNSRIIIPVASILYRLGQLEEALRVLAHRPKDLECVALTVQTLLFINRVDLAQREMDGVKTWSEDDQLALLLEGWVNLRLGGAKYREALYIFEELAQAAPVPTSKLLSCQAVANLHLGRLPEAESLLLEALAKDGDDAEALANMVVCATLLQKPADVRARFLNQLRDVAPQHPLVESVTQKEALFDQCAQAIAH
ncbi:hypothetical protein IWQ60_011655 [Tieghemiomyces parasiticus]|uniref:Coatomer subunit epsilon n=1 Tax=Tieghemiomyces parasiticus TaxID=78921 RepID=A0A9W8DI90_9FUNG|nr:hypothetical protein IWQ60_011655 [Tieghemiomyces parasiticus]